MAGENEAPVGELTESKILDSLSSLDDQVPPPDDERITDPKDNSDEALRPDDEGDDDERLEPSDEDKDEKLNLSRLNEEDELVISEAPNRKLILKEFPELFKKFPTLERAIYREHEFSELFPTLTDAKEAVSARENLSKVESELFSGNIGDTLARLKNANPEAFNKVVNPTNLLGVLGRVDKDSRLVLIAHVIKNILLSAVDSGKKIDTGDDSDGRQLQIAAKLLHKFLFNDFNVTAPETNTVTDERPNPKEEELNRREQEQNARDLRNATEQIASTVKYRIESFVKDNIDPKDQMSPYVKANAIRDVMRTVDEEMSSDARFRAGINKLYEEARKNNYSEASKKQIRINLLSKAQTIIPIAIRKIRSEALKDGSGKFAERPKYRGVAPSKNDTQQRSQNGNSGGKKKPDASSVSSVLDYLNS